MSPQFRIRLSVCAALALAVAPLVSDAEPPGGSNSKFFTGKVVPLAPLLTRSNVKLDADAAAAWYALSADTSLTLKNLSVSAINSGRTGQSAASRP